MVVLATKVYVAGGARERALRSLESLLSNQLNALSVEFDVSLREDDFPAVELTGPDATVARNLIVEEWGELPRSFEHGESYVGTLTSWDADGFVLDAGRPVEIPADSIELGPGSPGQIRERFGLVQHLRMRFVVEKTAGSESSAAEDIRDDGSAVIGSLADDERDRLYEWRRGPGRVNVNSATRSEVRATLNRAGHARDVVTVERLGLLEQSVVCKSGTDPPGLLASVGRYLPSELRCVVP